MTRLLDTHRGCPLEISSWRLSVRCVGSLILSELVECCFTSTETAGLLGAGAQDGQLDSHTAPDLCPLGGQELFDYICALTFSRWCHWGLADLGWVQERVGFLPLVFNNAGPLALLGQVVVGPCLSEKNDGFVSQSIDSVETRRYVVSPTDTAEIE